MKIKGIKKEESKKEQENFALYIPANVSYIARVQPDMFDEVQRILIAIENEHPIGLEGAPGTGKNQLIDFVASIRNKSVGRVRCTEELTLESMLGKERISSEKTDKGMAINSRYEEGIIPLTYAANADLVLDEFNQLLPTVQKGMNSMLEDKKTICVDGKHREKSGDGATYVTFNPKTGVYGQDLEKAVKDRLKIIPIPDISLELQARIVLMKAGLLEKKDILDGSIEERAVAVYDDNGKQRFKFLNRKGKQYVSPAGENFGNNDVFEYLFYNNKNEERLNFETEKEKSYKVARNLVELADDIEKFRTSGTNVFDEDFRESRGLDNVSKVSIEKGGLRILAKVMEDYALLAEKGYRPEKIMPTLARTYIDNICTMETRDMAIGKKNGKEVSIYEVLEMMAAKRGFFKLDKKEYASLEED